MIELDEVSVTTGAVTLLAPVSVTVHSGEALVVRGGNGSGKTTLLRVLAGVQRPSGGAARLSGKDISERSPEFRRRVAAMIGLPPMASDLTVWDHVLLVATSWEATSTGAQARAHRVIEALELSRLRNRFPHELSSGQTQLLGIAMVVARPFDVLLLDEPEQRLDPEHIAVVLQLLQQRRNEGATLVIATHHPELAAGIQDRTIRLAMAA